MRYNIENSQNFFTNKFSPSLNERFEILMTRKSLIICAELRGTEFMLYGKVMRARIHVIELQLLINYYFDTLREGCSNVISAILTIRRVFDRFKKF